MKPVLFGLTALALIFTLGFFIPWWPTDARTAANLIGVGIALDLISISLLVWSEIDRILRNPGRFPLALPFASVLYLVAFFASASPAFGFVAVSHSVADRFLLLLILVGASAAAHFGVGHIFGRLRPPTA